MLKGIPSFNKLRAELQTRKSFWEFCLFKNEKLTYPNRMPAESCKNLKPSGCGKISVGNKKYCQG
jgi:hypothetical protein